MDYQWKILCIFFQNNSKQLKLNNYLERIANKYNSGHYINPSIFFSKIKCDNKSYYEWIKVINLKFNN